jgi:hypothetical protein
MNYLPRLALNLDSPDLSLPSSKDYRREPLAFGTLPLEPFSQPVPLLFSLLHLIMVAFYS